MLLIVMASDLATAATASQSYWQKSLQVRQEKSVLQARTLLYCFMSLLLWHYNFLCLYHKTLNEVVRTNLYVQKSEELIFPVLDDWQRSYVWDL